MKLSKRETYMITGLLFVVLIAAFWFIILAPARDMLSAAQSEYDTLKEADDVNQAIIDSVPIIEGNRNDLKDNVAAIENSLLPKLDNEVIIEHLANIFEDNGLKFITEITCDEPVFEQLTLSDGSYSSSTVVWVRVNMKICGTDGVTEGGIPAVGYDEFIASVKTIEAENPSFLHVSSISMEDTTQGFQYFNVSVDVYAFSMPTRIEAYDPTEPYITWDREEAPTGGEMGIGYFTIPPSKLTEGFLKPFAAVQITGPTDAADGQTASPAITPTPTPEPTTTPTVTPAP